MQKIITQDNLYNNRLKFFMIILYKLVDELKIETKGFAKLDKSINNLIKIEPPTSHKEIKQIYEPDWLLE